MEVPVVVLVAVLIPVAAIFYMLVFPRFGPHYTSKLTCPKCNRTFDYKWVPGASLTAVRLGPSRYMRCPLCHEWSDFDIVSTRVQAPSDSGAGTNPSKVW